MPLKFLVSLETCPTVHILQKKHKTLEREKALPFLGGGGEMNWIVGLQLGSLGLDNEIIIINK